MPSIFARVRDWSEEAKADFAREYDRMVGDTWTNPETYDPAERERLADQAKQNILDRMKVR